MQDPTIAERQILEELRNLEPRRWFEVLDFIGYLKHQPLVNRPDSSHKELTARDLLQSPLVGLWANRGDIEDSLSYAHKLRRQAEHRTENRDDIA